MFMRPDRYHELEADGLDGQAFERERWSRQDEFVMLEGELVELGERNAVGS